MNFIFLKFFLIVYFSKTIICDSSVIITLGVMLVNHKIQIFLFFSEVYSYKAIFPIILVIFINRNFSSLGAGALRRSHFQCGKCEGRRSQSSEARTLPRAPTPLGTEGVLHLRCVTRLTFVCMLRYSEWDTMPIWFLVSSIFIVERCADLVLGFFDIYSGTLCRSGSWILLYL